MNQTRASDTCIRNASIQTFMVTDKCTCSSGQMAVITCVLMITTMNMETHGMQICWQASYKQISECVNDNNMRWDRAEIPLMIPGFINLHRGSNSVLARLSTNLNSQFCETRDPGPRYEVWGGDLYFLTLPDSLYDDNNQLNITYLQSPHMTRWSHPSPVQWFADIPRTWS